MITIAPVGLSSPACMMRRMGWVTSKALSSPNWVIPGSISNRPPPVPIIVISFEPRWKQKKGYK